MADVVEVRDGGAGEGEPDTQPLTDGEDESLKLPLRTVLTLGLPVPPPPSPPATPPVLAVTLSVLLCEVRGERVAEGTEVPLPLKEGVTESDRVERWLGEGEKVACVVPVRTGEGDTDTEPDTEPEYGALGVPVDAGVTVTVCVADVEGHGESVGCAVGKVDGESVEDEQRDPSAYAAPPPPLLRDTVPDTEAHGEAETVADTVADRDTPPVAVLHTVTIPVRVEEEEAVDVAQIVAVCCEVRLGVTVRVLPPVVDPVAEEEALAGAVAVNEGTPVKDAVDVSLTTALTVATAVVDAMGVVEAEADVVFVADADCEEVREVMGEPLLHPVPVPVGFAERDEDGEPEVRAVAEAEDEGVLEMLRRGEGEAEPEVETLRAIESVRCAEPVGVVELVPVAEEDKTSLWEDDRDGEEETEGDVETEGVMRCEPETETQMEGEVLPVPLLLLLPKTKLTLGRVLTVMPGVFVVSTARDPLGLPVPPGCAAVTVAALLPVGPSRHAVAVMLEDVVGTGDEQLLALMLAVLQDVAVLCGREGDAEKDRVPFKE